jgi:sec-independent protein translocase protein TatB
VFENVGYGEILVLLLAGLFILGPERLPEAASWLARTLKQVREFATGARDQLRSELGPELDEFRKPMEELREPLAQLRSLRNYDPRRAVSRAIFDDEYPMKPNGFAPPPGGPGQMGGPGQVGVAGQMGGPAPMHPAAEPPRRLASGERPPIDPDAT